MRHIRRTTSMVLAALAASAAVAPLLAQQRERPPSVFNVSPYVGYMVFGEILKGPLGTNVSNKAGPVFGAQAALDIAPGLSLVGNVAAASSDLRVGVPILGGLDIGKTDVLLYDGGLQLSLGDLARGSQVRPFIQAGVGAVRYKIDAELVTTEATNLAFNFGGGLDYQVSPNIGLRFLAKDYVGKFDFKEATEFFDLEGNTAHNVALSVGAVIKF